MNENFETVSEDEVDLNTDFLCVHGELFGVFQFPCLHFALIYIQLHMIIIALITNYWYIFPSLFLHTYIL